MPTMEDIFRRAVERCGPAVGRTADIASLTTTTAVVTELATGSVGGERYRFHHMVRWDAASAADYLRICTDFAASTGTLTHDGANYSDTTATGEKLDILNPSLEPWLMFPAVNDIVQRMKRLDVTEFPTFPGDRYWLGDLSWVERPADVYMVTYRPCPQLSRNRYMERWGAYNTSGALTPDWWSIAGGGTMSRSTIGATRGRYTVAVVRATTDATFSQAVGLLEGNGVDSLRSQQVTVVARVRTSTASAVRAFVNDGSATYSAFHSGDGTTAELSATITVGASASALSFGIFITADTTAYVDECYLVFGAVSDAVRRDSYPEESVNPRWYQDATLSAELPEIGWGGQYLFYCVRGYPEFDATRLSSRAAIADTTDAPELPMALGLAGQLFKMLADREGQDAESYRQKSVDFMAQFERESLRHLANQAEALKGFIKLPQRSFSIPARRFGRG